MTFGCKSDCARFAAAFLLAVMALDHWPSVALLRTVIQIAGAVAVSGMETTAAPLVDSIATGIGRTDGLAFLGLSGVAADDLWPIPYTFHNLACDSARPLVAKSPTGAGRLDASWAHVTPVSAGKCRQVRVSSATRRCVGKAIV